MLLLSLIFLINFIKLSLGSDLNHRIHYGRNVSENERIPYIVGLLHYFGEIGDESSLLWVCGGTLLSGTLVLTAGHCVE